MNKLIESITRWFYSLVGYCPKCGAVMDYFGGGQSDCPNCNYKERA